MRFKSLSLILLALAISSASQSAEQFDNENGSGENGTSDTIENTPSNTTESTPSSSTESTPSSSTESTSSNTTESAPSSTTESTLSSSTESTTTSSTESTTTSTTESTTTSTTASTTTAEPPIGWEEYPAQVSNKDGKAPCIFSKMDITLKVTYQKTDESFAEGTITVPEKAKVSGTCDDTLSTMTLTWAEATTVITRYIRSSSSVYASRENSVTFYFKKDNSSIRVDQIDIDIILDKDHFPDAKNSSLNMVVGKDLNLFASSPQGNKYVCNVEKVVSTDDNSVKLVFTDVSLIAFNEDRDLSQKSVESCTEPEVESANVGAIVGGVIAALVVIGIVGFIIWRRRRNSYTHSEVP